MLGLFREGGIPSETKSSQQSEVLDHNSNKGLGFFFRVLEVRGLATFGS